MKANLLFTVSSEIHVADLILLKTTSGRAALDGFGFLASGRLRRLLAEIHQWQLDVRINAV